MISNPIKRSALAVAIAIAFIASLGVCKDAASTAPTERGLYVYWQDNVEPSQRQAIRTWVEDTFLAIERAVGPWPFDVHVSIHTRRNAGEPVPWAHTRRNDRQGVVLYLDPSYPVDRFFNDWTLPHEFSHLLLPYLGPEHAWFAEGFASFMQYQVLHAMGRVDEKTRDARYRDHLAVARAAYPFDELSVANAAQLLKERQLYPSLYWGGAAYFMQVDHFLQSRDTSLLEVLERYLVCCRRSDQTIEQVLASLDRAANSTIFSRTYRQFLHTPGFPSATLP